MAQAVGVVNPSGSVEVLDCAAGYSSSQTVVLRLNKPKNEKKVQWDEAVVDNEHMGKKKSKCCCIFEKPHNPDGDSDGESDGEGDKDCCHEHRVARAYVPRQIDT